MTGETMVKEYYGEALRERIQTGSIGWIDFECHAIHVDKLDYPVDWFERIGIQSVAILRATAIAAGLVGTLLHWIAETVHQLGHAAFARKIGYPMIGIRYWGWLSASVYPTNEPSLPGAIHIRRALGGPATSFLAAIAAAAVFLVLNASSASDVVRWLSFFFLIENVFVFCLGALLPLGFTDGSTLLRWWGKS